MCTIKLFKVICFIVYVNKLVSSFTLDNTTIKTRFDTSKIKQPCLSETVDPDEDGIIFCFEESFPKSTSSPNITLLNNIQVETCTLPEHPKFGQWSIYGSSKNLLPQMKVKSKDILEVKCDPGYILKGNNFIVCANGNWSEKIGTCLKTCPPRHSTPTLTIVCTQNEKELQKCTNAVDGTIAKYSCAPFHEDKKKTVNSTHICRNGTWSHPLPECVKACGIQPISPGLLVINGSEAIKGSHPWQAALYIEVQKNKYSLQCGGSMIHEKFILSAAHCVTNLKTNELLNKEIFVVAVGKHYRDFNDSRDKNSAQFSSVAELIIPSQYQGDLQNYFGDIALLVTTKSFTLTRNVGPVCVDWEFQHEDLYLKPYAMGTVAGWGHTKEKSNPSQELKVLEVPYIEPNTCKQNLPLDYHEILTFDKMCAGYINQSKSACEGDSGGGLIFNNEYDGKFYVSGVVSVSPQSPTGGCDSQHYTLYTKVSFYVNNFILKKFHQFGVFPRSNNCILPQHPPFGRWSVLQSSPVTSFFPGQSVQLWTTLQVSCNINYKLSGAGISLCINGTWTPEIANCLLKEVKSDKPKNTSCVLPEHPKFGQLSVLGLNSYSPGMLVDDKSILQVKCNDRYALDGTDLLILCVNGVWSSSVARCLKICPPIYSTNTLTVTCNYKNKEITNCTNAVHGTVAKFKCAPFHSKDSFGSSAHVCIDGTWSKSIPTCQPVCGQRTVSAQPLIINGVIANKSEFPWQAALYRKSEKLLICGGTLITQRIILTAAHCITNSKGEPSSKDLYIVAVGKYYRKFDDVGDVTAQFSELEALFVSPLYKADIQNYNADIGILVTKRTFTLSSAVQPICVDWINDRDFSQASEGVISGWGFTSERENPSDELRSIQLPLIPTKTCYQNLQEMHLPYLTADKMCAGYLNGTAICKGDAGGGLAVKNFERYYIVGIASNGPRGSDGGCDSHQYALYTNVSRYIEFIIDKVNQFEPKLS